jgi:hypothetical protein
MKKIILYLLVLFLVFFGGIFTGRLSNANREAGPFSASISDPRSNPNFVPNKKTAIKIAKAVWLPIYGQKDLMFRFYFVQLQNDIWIIEGQSIWSNIFSISGGGPYIKIDKATGKILEVSHTK